MSEGNRRMGDRKIYTIAQKAEIIQKIDSEVRVNGTHIKIACKKFGISDPTYYVWRKSLSRKRITKKGGSRKRKTKRKALPETKPDALTRAIAQAFINGAISRSTFFSVLDNIRG